MYNPVTAAKICMTPPIITVGIIYSFPRIVETPAIEVATAAVEPDIIVGIPPNNEVMRDIIMVFCSPVFGDNPIIKANAIDSL